jgi:hypothetical protein
MNPAARDVECARTLAPASRWVDPTGIESNGACGIVRHLDSSQELRDALDDSDRTVSCQVDRSDGLAPDPAGMNPAARWGELSLA